MDQADLDWNGFTHERKREQNKQTLERRAWQRFLPAIEREKWLRRFWLNSK